MRFFRARRQGGYERKLAVCLGLSVLLPLASTAHAATCSTQADTVAFKTKNYLDVMLHAGSERIDSRKGQLYAVVLAQSGNFAQEIPMPVQTAAEPLSLLAEFVVFGKWWNLMGELAANPGVSWRYRDSFTVWEGREAHHVDRQALAKYPDLERRLAAARPTFDRIEITARGVHDVNAQTTIYSPRLHFSIHDNDVLVPPEAKAPYRVPMSPPRWKDRLAIGDLDERNVISEWAKLQGIRCPQVVVHNLRIPSAELLAIAKAMKAHAEEDQKSDALLALTDKDYRLPRAEKPYQGPTHLREPFVAPPTEAEVLKDGDKLGLRAKAMAGAATPPRVIFSSSDYSRAAALDKEGRFFVFGLRGGGNHVYGANGKKVSIEGVERFSSVEARDGGFAFYMSDRHAGNLVYTTRVFHSQRNLPDTPEALEAFKRNDRLKPCPRSTGGGGVMLAAPTHRYELHQVPRIFTDAQLNITGRDHVIWPGTAYPSRRGDRHCQ